MASGTSFGEDYSPWLSWLPYILLGLLLLATICGFASTKDIILVFAATLFRNWKAAYRILQFYDLHFIFKILAGVLTLFATAQIARQITNWTKTKTKSTAVGPKPLLFPSRTTHTRFSPKSHSFSYSYLLVGIPVGWQGSVGGMLSADQGSDNRSWYSIDAGDYLDRGHRELGLDGKLRKFIKSQGFNTEDYPYAYLITAPKFLGYSFNPVSFWYLYSANKELSAMILEVNNTFDERHMYLLKPSEDSPKELDSIALEDNTVVVIPATETSFSAPVITGPPKKPIKFMDSWNKEFHVSPFNSRKGTYSLVAYDPLYPSMSGRGSVDSTITLKSSKAYPKLVARIFSEGNPIDPEFMSSWQRLKFLVAWWWVGLVTFPRIVGEAGKLFFKRKLHIWFRPEPLNTSIGRHADAIETVLEANFRSYLSYLVRKADSPLKVRYAASGIRDSSEVEVISEAGESDKAGAKTLEVRVLTPMFYSRFVHYAHDLGALFSEFSESGTIWLSEPSLLRKLVFKKSRSAHSVPDLMNYLYFVAIKTLRQRPIPIWSPNNAGGVAEEIVAENPDIRAFRLSAMDEYFLSQSTVAEQRSYRKAVLKLFISDRVALGNVDLLEAEIVILKCLIAWVLARSISVS